jgi:hypothetical protein
MNLRQRVTALFNLRASYRQSFTGASGQRVLLDLARFCRVGRAALPVSRVTGMTDTHALALTEGRREVFQYLTKRLRMTDEQINNLMERANEHDE